jgi:hypothetical protein
VRSDREERAETRVDERFARVIHIQIIFCCCWRGSTLLIPCPYAIVCAHSTKNQLRLSFTGVRQSIFTSTSKTKVNRKTQP